MSDTTTAGIGSHDPSSDDSWWRQAAVYQIYPRSFADANDDGVGDILGIISRVPYLQRLGIDAVWMSPFYPSELADGGYDVADYRNIDPRIGTLEQFDELVAALHTAGIRLIIDIVPNHSSNKHPWFQEALEAQPGSPARDRYIFRDGRGPSGSEPPAEWTSQFGGPAWTRTADGQWYFHTFAIEQPDFNWNSREVRDDFLRTLRFWGDRGVNGFRVDVANTLTKDFSEPLPTAAELKDRSLFPVGQHPMNDRDDVHEVFAEWRTVLDSYSPPLSAVAEAWVPADRRVHYARAESLGQAFNFDLLEANWNPAQFRQIIRENLDLAAESGASSTWVFSNHDVVRHATRYGLEGGGDGADWLLSGGTTPPEDRALGLSRAQAVTLLAFALPGSCYIYQGEELGLPEVADILTAARQDPTFFRSEGKEVGRDGCRIPIPWLTQGPSFGFGHTAAPHLPQPSWFGPFAVEAQEGVAGSTLEFYREALEYRRQYQSGEELAWLQTADDALAFRRPNGLTSTTNFGARPVELPPGRVVMSSGAPATDSHVQPNTTVWTIEGL